MEVPRGAASVCGRRNLPEGEAVVHWTGLGESKKSDGQQTTARPSRVITELAVPTPVVPGSDRAGPR